MDLEAIQARADAATGGEWQAVGDQVCLAFDGQEIAWLGDSLGNQAEDAVFIAAARTDVPLLVARVRQLETALVLAGKVLDEVGAYLVSVSDEIAVRRPDVAARLLELEAQCGALAGLGGENP